MVNLMDIFGLLATGEFSNLSLSRTDTGSIKQAEYPKIVRNLNLGLTEIYKRFSFLEKELTLHVDPDVSQYFLRTNRQALLADLSSSLYIEVPADGSVTDPINIVEVKGVLDEDDEELVINNRSTTPAILQMAPDVLKITGVDTATVMTVIYQAYPVEIVLDSTFDPDTQVLDISPLILDALLMFIASKVYRPMGKNSGTADADKGPVYQQQYELACQKLEMFGLSPQQDYRADNFLRNGWA